MTLFANHEVRYIKGNCETDYYISLNQAIEGDEFVIYKHKESRPTNYLVDPKVDGKSYAIWNVFN